MQPLNPFLSAFSKSSLAAQCQPARQHIILVPCTDVILDSRDTETGAPLAESIGSDEFVGSHVIRIPGPKPGAGRKDSSQNLREMRGKAKVYNTINGRSIVIKDNLVYSNKGEEDPDFRRRLSTRTRLITREPTGFKALAHATLLNDARMVSRYPRSQIFPHLLHITPPRGN